MSVSGIAVGRVEEEGGDGWLSSYADNNFDAAETEKALNSLRSPWRLSF